MRTVFLGILLVLCIIRPTFSQSSNNPSVEFAGFGGDGEIILKDSKFDVFQGVYVKNNSNETKTVWVFLELMGSLEMAEEAISIPPGKTKIARFSIPPASKHLQKDMVKIRVE
ncbi:hypothetical protein [Treponema sp.]|uniref:hypothetical protein n=1 Tax=Treponema sp. TaxID=166 RepID=UPI0025E90AE0|nr:hypothetical protein [Treponema sp.]MBR4322927.1 hypothetical protein [Treponema sp.]